MTSQDVMINSKQGAVGLYRELSGDAILEAIYDDYGRILYRYALTLVGSTDDAEDIVQDVFAHMMLKSSLLRKTENLKAYLFTSTRNAAYNLLRLKQKDHRLHEAIYSNLCHTSVDIVSDDELDELNLRRSFLILPIEQREVVLLKLFEGMTFKQISRMVGVSANTVASRYRYAIEKLRQSMEDDNNG